jgi:RND family efflux transporter, MFP subunit
VKRILLILVFVAVLGGGAWFLARRAFKDRDEAPHEPKTVVVAARTLEQFVSATGTVQPASSSEVRSEVSGRVVAVHVKEGQNVEAGQLLLELDQAQLRSDIKAAELEIQSAELQAEKLAADLRRATELAAEKLIPEKEITDTKAEAGRARIQCEILQAKLDRLRTELAKTAIVAPIAGTVLNLTAREGGVITGASSVSEGTVLMELADLQRLEVQSSVNEIDVGLLKPDMPVEVTFDSSPGTKVEGRLSFIAPSAGEAGDKGRGLQRAGDDSKTRTFRMIASLDTIDAAIRPGMSANLRILVARAENVPSVEISAIFVDDEGSKVYVRKGDAFEPRAVETGVTDLKHIELKSGAAVDDELSLERPSGGKASKSRTVE